MSEIVKKERQSNFELLRIISMLMIVTLHTLSNEGILECTSRGGLILGWILEALCIVASNIYILISGYFSCESKFTFKKFIKLWLTVIFYSYGFSALLYFFKNDFNLVYAFKDLKLVACPVLFGEYWFVTNYMLLYLLSPYLNMLIKNLSKKDYKRLIVILLLVFSVLKTIIPTSYTFDKTGGYGIIWFVILYIIAGYIRLHYNESKKINHNWYLLIYVLISGFVAFLKIYSSLGSTSSFLVNHATSAFNYNHILIILSSISLFLYFKDVKIENNKIINTISKATFGVYLIHEQYFVRKVLWTNLVPLDEKASSPYLILFIILSVLIIFLLASLLELAREFLAGVINTQIDKWKTKKEN